MTSLRNIAFIASTFFALGAISLPSIDIYYYYLTIIVTFPLLIYKHRSIEKNIIIVFTFLALSGMVNVLLGNNELLPLIKNIVGPLTAYVFFFLIIRDNQFDLVGLTRIYYRTAEFFAIIGLIQFFSYLIGFKYGYDYSWLGLRTYVAEESSPYFFPVHSLANEPSFFTFVQAPALYISLCHLFRPTSIRIGSKVGAILIIVSYPLSQASTGYFSLLLSIILININRITITRILIIAASFACAFSLLYQLIPKFQERIDSSLALATGKIIIDGTSTGNANGSALILFNHFLVAKRNALDHPFGTGVGSHHIAFERYNSVHAWFTGYGKDSIKLNVHDASSMFNRVLSEMGFFGITILFIFLIRNFLRTGPDDLVLINQASFVIICTALLRNGHYFTFGIPFFVLTYYYSYKFAKKRQAVKETTHSCL